LKNKKLKFNEIWRWEYCWKN